MHSVTSPCVLHTWPLPMLRCDQILMAPAACFFVPPLVFLYIYIKIRRNVFVKNVPFIACIMYICLHI